MSKQTMANQIFNRGLVNQENNDTFSVEGSNNRRYTVKRNQDPKYNYQWYCNCPAWKFDTSRECKHCLAVELFETSTNNQPKIQQKSVAQIKAQGARARRKRTEGYRIKKRTKEDLKSENIIEWSEPDGSKSNFKFDSEGNLIGRSSA